MSEKENKVLDDKNLEQVDGAGLFSSYNDGEYAAAGVTIIGPGTFYNDGYSFQGAEITTNQANALVYFFKANGHVASSVQEAVDFGKQALRELRQEQENDFNLYR